MVLTKQLKANTRIALIAHYHKKEEMIQWSLLNKTMLAPHQLFATGTTGKLVEAAFYQPVIKFLNDPLEGDQ